MFDRSVEIADLILRMRKHGSDFTEVEAKRASGGCPTLGPTLSAFGNMPGGGMIVLGLDESQGYAASGVGDPAAIMSAVVDQARTAVTPPLNVTPEEVRFEGETLVLVAVAPLPSNDRSARYRGKAYLRQGDGDYVMSEQEIQQLYALRERPRHDSTPVPGTSTSDLDEKLTAEFVLQARSSSPRLQGLDDRTVLQRKGILTSGGESLTVAGLYALGNYPQQFMPDLSITAAVQHRVSGGRGLTDLSHFDGPLPDLLEAALRWVHRNTRTTVRFEVSGQAYDQEELPLIAVRELVANALVHRDLSPHAQSKRVEIRLRDDKLVITNPGGLYGVSAEQLGQPEGKSAVNEFLYEICKLVRTSTGARVIEGEGGGIQEVQRALADANMQPPKFIDRGVDFAVLLPRHALIEPADLEWLGQVDPDHELSSVQRQVVTSMRHGKTWTNSLMRRRFAPLDSTEARIALQSLVGRDFAQTRGERGQTEYFIADDYLAEHVSEPATAATLAPKKPEQRETRTTSMDLVMKTLRSDGELTTRAIADKTDLTEYQIRYALKKAMDAGEVVRSGGQGIRNTTYRFVQH